MANWQLILSCEHASHAMPADWSEYLDDAELLTSHMSWDAGALNLAQHLSRHLHAPLHAGQYSRLLVDLNRSLHHPRLHGQAIRQLDKVTRAAIVAAVYQPFRDSVAQAIGAQLDTGQRVLHVSVHSFTPVLNGKTRTADIGLLYDPSRRAEKDLCLDWQQQLHAMNPHWRIRRNYPYAGVQDGHVTALRRQFPDANYTGIELEVNQQLVDDDDWRPVKQALCSSLGSLLPDCLETI